MKSLGLLIVLCFVSQAYALDLNKLQKEQCEKTSVEVDHNKYQKNPLLTYNDGKDHFFLQRMNFDGKRGYVLSTHTSRLEEAILLNTDARKINDFVINGEKAYLLGDYNIFEYDLVSGAQIGTLKTLDGLSSYKSHARAFDLYEGNFYIAHGNQGVVVRNLETGKLVYRHNANTTNENGHYSRAESLVALEGRLYILMTASSEEGFDGIAVLDTKTRQIVNLGEYKRSKGVVAPYASIFTQNGDIYVNNMGWIHYFKTSHLLKKKRINPTWIAIKGINSWGRYYKMITGDFIFANNQVYGCHLKQERVDDQVIMSSEVANANQK